MKNLLIIIALVSNTFAVSELKWVDEQIAAIQPMRKGMQEDELLSLKDPFIFLGENHYRKKSIRFSKTHKVKRKKRRLKHKYTNKKYKKVQKPKIVYVTLNIKLDAIMNKSILINGNWYREGDRLKGFRIMAIDNGVVSLKKGNKRAKLSMENRAKKLNFKMR